MSETKISAEQEREAVARLEQFAEQTPRSYTSDDVTTVLQLLKEKDAEIERLNATVPDELKELVDFIDGVHSPDPDSQPHSHKLFQAAMGVVYPFLRAPAKPEAVISQATKR